MTGWAISALLKQFHCFQAQVAVQKLKKTTQHARQRRPQT